MKIENGVLLSINDNDIKDGLLKLPENVKEIANAVIREKDDLEKVIALGLERIGDDNFRYCNALVSFEAPVLTQIGNYNFRQCNALVSFEAPVLTQIGDDNFIECNALVSFKIKNNIYDVKYVDSYSFIVENIRSSKGFKIYYGYNMPSFENAKPINKKYNYVAEKDGFTAHGSTIKSAISDVQFKIASEKLKNQPIYEDTPITVQHYRLITGACDIGCRQFMEDNNILFKVEDEGTINEKTIEKEPILAKDLLPLLEKKGAYGLNKFKQLLQDR